MRRVLRDALALTLGLAALSSTAAAQDGGGLQFVAGGGSSLAIGDFGDVANNGPHLIGGVQFVPAEFPIGIRVDGMWHRISGDEDALGADDADFQIFNGTVNGLYRFPVSPETRIQPYVLAGVGIYNYKLTGDDVIDSESETDFGFNAGAGFDYRATENLGIFLEARFHNVFVSEDVGDDLNLLPITVGVRIGR